jgi:hypothetical protein
VKQTLIILTFILFYSFVNGQNINVNSLPNSSETTIIYPDTLKSFLVKKDPPYLFKSEMSHQDKSFGNKFIRASLFSITYNTIIMSGLVFAPESFSKWENKEEKFKFSSIINQYKQAYTTPPIIDHDLWMTNYIGHPYQGGFYYNTLRCQGGTVLQSSLFCLGRALLWEYGWEASVEQPSVQDLIVTPIGGILVGEASHLATIEMSKNGFRWYEIVATCILNPSYVVNNNFKFNTKTNNFR